jgi:endo-1,4-beta-xylanase
MISRRSFINTSSRALMATSLPSFRALCAPTDPGLKDLVPAGVLVGVVVDQWQMQSPQWLPLILKNFNLVTLGKLKWGFLRPSSSGFDFRETDWMVNFCAGKGIAMHGHNLCWNANNPAWLAQTLTRKNAAAMLTEHIQTVVKRYAGQVSSWDVVNEPVASWMGRADGLYTGPWLDALGPEYIDIAFHATAEADPKALRVLNVAHVEQGGTGSDTARLLTLKLVEALMKRGVPVQAIGFESHLAGDYSGRSTMSRASFVRELRQLGLQILLTETDVDDTKLAGDTTRRDTAVSECYGDYLISMLSEAQPKRVIFFSPSDQKNWYDAVHTVQYTRGDGMPHRPGLFDSSLMPKKAYATVASALRGYRG